MRSHRSLALAALAALAAMPGTLRGQEPADTVAVDELVVTGTRVAVPRAAVPAGVTVITRDELQDRGVTHVLDALRAVPGLAVVQPGAFGATASIFLRGGESDYVQVLVDGVPVNEPGGRADLAALVADDIERIEIVRGPASVLYGSDAVTGVIQIFTRTGRNGAPRVTARVRGGSAPRHEADARAATLAYGAGVTGGGERLDYALSASRFDTDGIYAYNNDFHNRTASGRLRVRPDDRTEIGVSARWFDGEYHYPTDGAGALADRNAFQLEERTTLALEAGRFLTDRLEARLLLTGSLLDRSIDDRPDDAADTLGFFAYRSQADITRRSADAHLNLHLSEATVLTAGVELERQEESSTSEYRSQFGDDSGEFEVERSNRGYYAQALAAVGDLSLTAGARLDDNDAFGTFTTARAGAAWRLPTGTRLRASFGTAFKEPTFFENFAEGFVKGNPELSPERSRSWEAGVEHAALDGRLVVSGTWFDQRFRDMIQYKAQEWGSTEPNYFNVAEASAAGIEAELKLRPVAGLDLSTSYTWLDSEVEDAGYQSGPNAEYVEGQRLIRRPTHTLGFAAAYRVAERGAVRLDVTRVGERDDLDFAGWPAERVTLPAYTRVDLGAEAQLLRPDGRRPGLTGTLRVDNLFDAAYDEVVHFPARRRTIFLGARVGFGI